MAQVVRYAPDASQRRMVEMMVGVGVQEADIARVLGIDLATLHLHHGMELETGQIVDQTADGTAQGWCAGFASFRGKDLPWDGRHEGAIKQGAAGCCLDPVGHEQKRDEQKSRQKGMMQSGIPVKNKTLFLNVVSVFAGKV